MHRRLPVILLAIALPGCLDETYVPQDRTDRTPRQLSVTHRVGGAHHCSVIEGGIWFVSQGATILALDPNTGKVRGECQVVPDGRSGAIVDMAPWRGGLMAVIDEHGVAQIDTRSGRTPTVTELIEADALGVRPKQLSIVGDSLFVSGDGGVVRLSDRRRFLTTQGRVGAVAMSERGLVAVVDRRVVTLEGGDYVGAATFLAPLPSSLGIEGGLVFALQNREGAALGIMGPDIRERSSDVVPGLLRRLRVIDDRLWAVTDSEIVTWEIARGTIANPIVIRLKGGRDIAAINENYFGVVGSFGRSVLRLHDDATGEGDEFIRVTRSPGRLDVAISDQRTIVASSVEGTWSYLVRGEAKLTDQTVPVWGIPAREVSAAWGKARIIGEDRGDEVRGSVERVEISTGTGGTRGTWTPPDGSRIWVLALVDGDLWVGHDRGISILRHKGALAGGGGAYPVQPGTPTGTTSAECPFAEIGSVRLEGPVIHLFPLRTGGGASWVSQWGGFGVVEWRSPSSQPRQRGTT